MRPGFIDLFDDVVGVRVRSSCVCVWILETQHKREKTKRELVDIVELGISNSLEGVYISLLILLYAHTIHTIGCGLR
jgi:hypothetical protein